MILTKLSTPEGAVILTSSDYAALPFAERERIRETAHERYLAGGEPGADLFATEASLRVRYPFPTAARVMFTLAPQDETGPRVHLIAV